jgi:ribosomal-protein-alanine N-acetyltransferase
LEVRRSNEAALSLYRGFGFRAVGIRPNYYSDEGEDAIVMVLDL